MRCSGTPEHNWGQALNISLIPINENHGGCFVLTTKSYVLNMNNVRLARSIARKFVPYNIPRICRPYSSAIESPYEHLKITTPKPGVGLSMQFPKQAMSHRITGRPINSLVIVTLNRPKALNALFTPLFIELNHSLRAFDADDSVGAVVVTGSHKAFAAGADIKEMKDKSFADAYGQDFIELWSSTTTSLKKPLISAVNGYALGGGCELALMTDIIYTSSNATFGQPEIKLGTIPGAGGSQRLTRAVGKSRAMDLILTGDNFSGKQAYEWGVAAKCFETAEECVEGALATAEKIAGMGRLAVKAAKEVVNRSQDLGVRDGVEFERRIFHGLFGSKDQKIGKSTATKTRSKLICVIGMTAFAEKKKAEWSHE